MQLAQKLRDIENPKKGSIWIQFMKEFDEKIKFILDERTK
jgi:hypothetical protein